MNRKDPSRGRPLAALVLLMAAWVGIRTVYWEPANTPDNNFYLMAELTPSAGTGNASRSGGAVVEGPQSIPGVGPFAYRPVLSGYYGPLAGYDSPAYPPMPSDPWAYHAGRQPPVRIAGHPASPSGAPQSPPFWWGAET